MSSVTTSHIWLIRHGETEWSLSGAHTGRTDILLMQRGREHATAIRSYLENKDIALVLSSPRQRALETARLAWLGEVVEIDENLCEWDYGEYEGRTTAQIREDLQNPDWSVWNNTPPAGEPIEHVAMRAHNVISRAMQARRNVAVFSHAHFLRIMAATWMAYLRLEADRFLWRLELSADLALNKRFRLFNYGTCFAKSEPRVQTPAITTCSG